MYHIVGSDGSVYGPVPAETMAFWIAEGRIDGDSLVSGGTQTEWVSLAQHPDLAPLLAGQPQAAIAGGADAPSPKRGRGRGRESGSGSGRMRIVAILAAAAVAVALLVAVGLAVAPLVASGRWALLPDVVASGFRGRGGATPRPTAPVRSNVPALDVSPIAGVRITAPAGALDRERTFSATPLSAAQMVRFDRQLQSGGLIALGGYDIDAGMTEADLFYKPATVSLDLETIALPKDLWSQVGIVNVADDGTVQLVPSHLKGKRLVFETYHNGAWMPVLIPLLIGTINYGWTVDRAELPKGDFAAFYWKPEDIHFRVMYPRTWTSRDPDGVKAAEEEYRRLIIKHKLTPDDVKMPPPSGTPQAVTIPTGSGTPVNIVVDPFSDLRGIGEQIGDRLNRLAALAADPEYRALSAKVRSEQWLTDVYLPVKVTTALTGLDRAYNYLDRRGFRKPGLAKFATTTDIFILDTSLGPELMGEVHNTWTTSPFMVLDGTKIPGGDVATLDAAGKKQFDEFQITALHELFHVVQSAYVFMDRNKYLWFNEATAVVLEGEAKEYYTRENNFAQTWETTIRSYTAFFDAMAFFDPENAAPNQAHGYGESYFVEFLRDMYFTTPAGKNAFLPALYEDFAGVRGGGVESLYRTTGGTPESLSKAFYAFSYAARNDLLNAYNGLPSGASKQTTTIDAANPVYVWRFADKSRPLSAQILEVTIPGGAGATPASTPSKPTDPVYVLSTNGVEEFGAITRLSAPAGGGEAWPEVRGGTVLSAKRQQHLMRVETYVELPAALAQSVGNVDAQGPMVFGMFRDQTPPTVEVKDQMVRIDWKPSTAASVKRSDGKRLLISEYRVTITTPDGRQTTFAAKEPHVEIPVATIDKLVTANKQANRNKVFTFLHGIGQADLITLNNMVEALTAGERPKLKVSYQEVADIPGSPKGPASAEAVFEIGDEARTFKDVTGTWAGRVPFSDGELMRFDLLQQPGGGFIGTMRFGGESIPIRGFWHPETQAWWIEARESNLWRPLFILGYGYVQKLPADKLYVAAPPAVLSRHNKAAPDLGWAPGPDDMNWQDFLARLSVEIQQWEAERKAAPQ